MDFLSQIYMHIKGNSAFGIIIFILLAIVATWGATKLLDKGSGFFLILVAFALVFFLYQTGILANIINIISI